MRLLTRYKEFYSVETSVNWQGRLRRLQKDLKERESNGVSVRLTVSVLLSFLTSIRSSSTASSSSTSSSKMTIKPTAKKSTTTYNNNRETHHYDNYNNFKENRHYDNYNNFKETNHYNYRRINYNSYRERLPLFIYYISWQYFSRL